MLQFSKQDRLLNEAEFTQVKNNGIKVGGESIFLSFLPGPRKRLGVIVSKKVGNAVIRNKIKRIMRDFFRVNRQDFLSGDFVFVAKNQAAKQTSQELRQQIAKLLQRLSKKTENKT
ncbi:MAG: ribonuclease P protein component [Pseudomonadota bacterium]